MDMKWSYILIAVITVVLLVLRLLNQKLMNRFKEEHPDAEKFLILKKDFFWTVSKICVCFMILINGLTLYGHRALNVPSILITILICIMTVLSSLHYMVVDYGVAYNIAGYDIEQEQVETVKVKGKGCRTKCQVLFKEELNGYQGMEFFLLDSKKESFLKHIQ